MQNRKNTYVLLLMRGLRDGLTVALGGGVLRCLGRGGITGFGSFGMYSYTHGLTSNIALFYFSVLWHETFPIFLHNNINQY